MRSTVPSLIGAANFQKLVVVGYSRPQHTHRAEQPGANRRHPDSRCDPGRRQRRSVTNDFTAYGGTNTLIGGGGTNAFTAYGGTNTLFGGSGTNNLSVSGGTGTLLGGSGANTYNLSGGGTYTAIGSTGTNTFNASSGTITITGGAGENLYYLTGAGQLHRHRRRGRECPGMSSVPASGDGIDLSQSGSTIR